MKTKKQIMDYLKDSRKAVEEMNDAGNSNDAFVYQGIVEGLEFVLDSDNENEITKEEQSVLESMAESFLYNNYPKSANGIFASAEVISKDNDVDGIIYNVRVQYGRQDDCYDQSFKQYVYITDKELKRVVKEGGRIFVTTNTEPKFYVNTEVKDYRDDFRSIDIPITECDIELFEKLVGSNDEFTWTFETNDGESININFIQDDESIEIITQNTEVK